VSSSDWRDKGQIEGWVYDCFRPTKSKLFELLSFFHNSAARVRFIWVVRSLIGEG
jgi:hypothetical protein